MATESGLTAAPINPTGLSAENLAKYEEALKASADALQARYESPNWFNVAAGFLKPQLGGFGASLGSANQALGDWQEKQRANALPVAQMRAELGKVGMLQSQYNQANDLIKAHTGPVTPELVQKVTALVGEGNPMAKSLADQLNATRADIANKTAKRAQDFEIVKHAKDTGFNLMTGERVSDVGLLATQLAATRGEPTTVAPVLPIAGPTGAPGAVPAPGAAEAPSLAIPSIALGPKGENEGPALKELRSINGMSPGADKDAAMADFAAEHPMNANAPKPSAKTEYLPTTLAPINTTGMVGPTMVAATDAYNAAVKATNERYKSQADALVAGANFNTLNAIQNPANNILTTAAEYPTLFNKFHNLIGQGGPFYQAIQNGFEVKVPGVGPVGVGLDLRSILGKSYTPTEQAILEDLANNYIKFGAANATRDNTAIAASGLTQPASTSLTNIHHVLNDTNKRINERALFEKLYAQTNPQSPTREADVLRHPDFGLLHQYHSGETSKITKAFLDGQREQMAAELAAKTAKGKP